MFWLPHGWFPYWAEWIISFPRAPVGSVSIASWQLACTGIVTLLSELVNGLRGLLAATESPHKPQGKEKEEPHRASETEKKDL